jgi:beta-1,4-N-acetylglucosaminyltransferase
MDDGTLRQVLITVGTTEFDGLIRLLSCERFISFLLGRGFNKVVFQIGNGSFEPPAHPNVSWFRFAPNLDSVMDASCVIISHCGAGTVLEVIERQKLLFVAVNPTLMDNHQSELAEALEEGGLAVFLRGKHFMFIKAAPVQSDEEVQSKLTAVISVINSEFDRKGLDLSTGLLPLFGGGVEKPDSSLFPAIIDEAMGFSSS